MTKAPELFDAEKTTDRLPFPALINVLRDAFAKGCHSPTRQQYEIAVKDQPDGCVLLMPAWSKADDERPYAGVKLVTVFPGNSVRGIPTVNSTYVLYDGSTGEQLAILDGDAITSRRTAAVAALAADYLARPEAKKLLVLGAGRVGRLLPYAYRSVRDINNIVIWDINQHYAEEMAARLNGEGLSASVAGNLEKAIGNADIISAATLATSPLINGDWVKPGTHIDLIGGFTPSMREADDRTIKRATIFIDTSDALREAGDLTQPRDAGLISNESLGALAALCAGETPDYGARSDKDITVFKTVGTALADLAAARLVFEGTS